MGLVRTHPRARARRRPTKGSFLPSQLGPVGAWYRMAASTPVSGEWETIVDVLGGASLVQTDADRKLDHGVSGNALPVGYYDGSACVRMPLGANNFSTSKFGVAWWQQAATVSGSQYRFNIYNNDASVRVLTLRQFNATLTVDVYIATNVDGRAYTTGSALTAGAWQYVRLQIDMTKTNEFDATGVDTDAKVRLLLGETGLALTASDIGLGGALTVLRSPTGAAIFGGLNDADAPTAPVVSGTAHGPNTYVLLDTPTAAQGALLMNFETPTAFTPASISAITSHLNVTTATVTGSGISSLPDLLNSNPAVQATDAARPPRVASANGVLVGQGVDDRMSWPANSANNQLVTWGFATHLIRDTSTTQGIYRSGLTTSSHPQATDSIALFLTSADGLSILVFADASGGQVRNGAVPGGTFSTTVYKFVTVEYNGAAATEAEKLVATIDGSPVALAFSDNVGTPGAMPSALQGQPAGTDIALWGQRTNATTSAFVGKMGPNIYVLGTKETGATEGLLTGPQRVSLFYYQRPT